MTISIQKKISQKIFLCVKIIFFNLKKCIKKFNLPPKKHWSESRNAPTAFSHFKAISMEPIVNQHQAAYHPLDAHYYSIVDEP
jgi:hypothetical protein